MSSQVASDQEDAARPARSVCASDRSRFPCLHLRQGCNVSTEHLRKSSVPSRPAAPSKRHQVNHPTNSSLDAGLSCYGYRFLELTRSHRTCYSASSNTSIQVESLLRDPIAISSLPFFHNLSSQQRGELLFQIGRLHLFGDGTFAASISTATLLLRTSADDFGYPEAQFLLGALAARSSSSRDERDAGARSVLYHHFGARGGSIASSMAMGYRHLYGYGVPKSCESALRHYKFAADRVVHAQTTARPIQVFSAPAPFRLSDKAGKSHQPAHADEDAQRVEYMRNKAVGSSDPLVLEKAASLMLFSDLRLHAHSIDAAKEQQGEAVSFLKRAAALGSFSAKALLGHVYAYGLGGARRDVIEAIRLYQEALNESAIVNKTCAEAANGLGLVYFHGAEGTSVDYERAMRLFKVSARSGHADGVYNTGVMLSKSHPQLGYDYLEIAAQAGHLKAQFQLARLEEKERFRDSKNARTGSRESALALTASSATCKEIVKRYKMVAENADEGSELLRRAATALFFDDDWELALQLYLVAAEMGYEVAESNAAWLLARHPNRIASHPSHTKLYRDLLLRGVAQDSVNAHVRYGDLLFEEGDFALAMFQYELADYLSHGKHGQALYSIGYMHEHGLGVPEQSREKASRYYELVGVAEPALKQVMRVVQLKLRILTVCSSLARQLGELWRSTHKWLIEGKNHQLGGYKPSPFGGDNSAAGSSALPPSSSSSELSAHRQMSSLPAQHQQEGVVFASSLRFTRDSKLQVKAPELSASQPLTIDVWINIKQQDALATKMVLIDLQETLQLELVRHRVNRESQHTSAWILQLRTMSALFAFDEAPLQTDEWHHIAVAIAPASSSTTSDLSISLFVDGEMKQRLDFHNYRHSEYVQAQVLAIGSSLTFSASPSDPASNFVGSLTHMRIWGSSLSASSVRLLTTAPQHEVLRNDNLVFEVHFDIQRTTSEIRKSMGDTTASTLVASSDIYTSAAVYPEIVLFPPKARRSEKSERMVQSENTQRE